MTSWFSFTIRDRDRETRLLVVTIRVKSVIRGHGYVCSGTHPAALSLNTTTRLLRASPNSTRPKGRSFSAQATKSLQTWGQQRARVPMPQTSLICTRTQHTKSCRYARTLLGPTMRHLVTKSHPPRTYTILSYRIKSRSAVCVKQGTQQLHKKAWLLTF
jgi:hypothetical protein